MSINVDRCIDNGWTKERKNIPEKSAQKHGKWFEWDPSVCYKKNVNENENESVRETETNSERTHQQEWTTKAINYI